MTYRFFILAFVFLFPINATITQIITITRITLTTPTIILPTHEIVLANALLLAIQEVFDLQ